MTFLFGFLRVLLYVLFNDKKKQKMQMTLNNPTEVFFIDTIVESVPFSRPFVHRLRASNQDRILCHHTAHTLYIIEAILIALQMKWQLPRAYDSVPSPSHYYYR